ncbi:MAG: phosphate acyltransferase, partial [bacterium]|nr:phosphate acyltransferase [bacterium]
MNNFHELKQQAISAGRRSVAVAGAYDDDLMKAVFQAASQGVIEPVLVGNPDRINTLLEELDLPAAGVPGPEIVVAETKQEIAATAASLVSSGRCDILMKGLIDTSIFLRGLLNDSGLRSDKLLSHVAVADLDEYPRLLAITDAAINIAPDLDEKAVILQNAVNLMCSLGVDTPKVAILGAVEKVNPKMPATMDAADLKQMWKEGLFERCIVDGPFAMDNAVSAESARTKGVKSPVAGAADILLLPTIETANVLYKAMTSFTSCRMGALVMGARKPVI